MSKGEEEGFNADSLGLTLREFGRAPLLDKTQEVELAKRIEAGDDSAREILTNANLRLVISIARKYQGQGMDLQDLIQEGTIGLMTAVEKFDWRLGYKFSTYATSWVKQAITRALADKVRAIRVPVHMVEVVNKVSSAWYMLSEDLGREPTQQELAELTGMDLKTIKKVQRIGLIEPRISLNSHGSGKDGETGELGDIVRDRTAVDPEESVLAGFAADDVRTLLMVLPERERKIIALRHGLIGEAKPMTLEEVGNEIGVTRERIRQIEKSAMEKLRVSAQKLSQRKEEPTMPRTSSNTSASSSEDVERFAERLGLVTAQMAVAQLSLDVENAEAYFTAMRGNGLQAKRRLHNQYLYDLDEVREAVESTPVPEPKPKAEKPVRERSAVIRKPRDSSEPSRPPADKPKRESTPATRTQQTRAPRPARSGISTKRIIQVALYLTKSDTFSSLDEEVQEAMVEELAGQ